MGMSIISTLFITTGGILKLLFQSIYWCKDVHWNFDKILYQITEIGNKTLPVATLIALSSGAVLSLQTGPTLASFGLEENLGSIVGLSMVKEIGPVMASILVAGRMGSAMAAEIGSMSVYNEIDALKTMNIDPVRFLVMPRFLATILSLPVLVVFMDVVGWFGGAVVATVNPEINLSMQVYFRNLADIVTVKAVFNGLIKAFFFGIIISIVSCQVGFGTKGGPKGIGISVTKAVVLSFVLVLVSDYFITRILQFMNLD